MLHSWYGRSPTFGNDTASGNSKPKGLQKVYLVATVVSAFSAAIGLSEGFTVMIKLWVQRLRPNFYALCGFDYSTLKCMADLERVREVRWVPKLFAIYLLYSSMVIHQSPFRYILTILFFGLLGA